MELLPSLLRTTYWIKDYLKGSPVRSQYNDIRSIMEDSIRGEEKRKQYLDQLLNYAIQYAPFYRHYSPGNFFTFPVVNKSILIDNYRQIKIDRDKIPFQDGPLFIQKTSGSTGTPFAIPQDTRKRYRRLAELKYFGARVGFKSHDKLVQLRTWGKWQGKTKLQSLKENIIPFDISKLDNERLEELCTIIRHHKVSALRGFASSIDILIRYAIDKDISLPSLKIMISGSESLQESTRELVKKYFKCNIISQYANEENGILAQEEPSHGLPSSFYLNHASYFFEILKLDDDTSAEYGELGRIVLTDLFNYAFPIIRYDTGDTGIMCKDAQNRNYPVIRKLYGRKVDLIFNTEGDVVHPTAISRMLKHYTQIKQWQFIQNSAIKYTLRLIIKESRLDVTEIKQALFGLLGDQADITIEFTDEIPILASGKRKPVVNNWKR